MADHILAENGDRLMAENGDFLVLTIDLGVGVAYMTLVPATVRGRASSLTGVTGRAAGASGVRGRASDLIGVGGKG